MKRAVTLKFGQLPSYKYSVDPYDQDSLGLGPRCTQKYLSADPDDGFVGPFPVALARPMEQSTAIPGAFPWALQWSATKDWVFLADNAAAAATRRIVAYEYDRTTNAFTWKGFITLTYPTATNHTIRGFRMTYDTYSTGTVAVSGTAVTGTGTAWQTARFAVGARIGFGSTDPTQITTWYQISAIGSDTSITLSSTAGTIASGTAFVIEEMRAVTVTTNATVTNGGLYVAKGLSIDTFLTIGTTIPAATTVDNIRAVYWLADATTVTNTTALGMGIQTKDSNTQHYAWTLDGTTSVTLFKYNLRAALSLTSGKDTANGFVLKSGASGTLTGTAGQLNNGRLATTSHGPGSGISCLYFTTGTRIYRSNDVSTITSGQTTWVADNAVEVPPGGTATIGVSGALSSIEYSSTTDRFLVAVNATTTPFRSYFTQYRTDGGQWDRIWGCDTRQIDQSSADSSVTPHPSMTGGPYSVWAEGGVMYICTIGATAILNRLYAIPMADWEYDTDDFVITPRIACPNADKFNLAFFGDKGVIGGATGKNLGMITEPFRAEYRTSGISDDSGAWTLLPDSGLMSGAGATHIQLRLSFRSLGLTMIPSRVTICGIVYDDLSTDDHWQVSVGNSDLATPRFAWRHSTAYGTAVPTLRVRIYDAVTGGLLIDDETVGATGTWEKSTDGGSSWGSYNTTDRANETTYIRYTPASIGSSIRVRALLTAA